MKLKSVDYDPFAQGAAPNLVPVDEDPFAEYEQPAPPPGEIIHGAQGSYVSDKPEVVLNRPHGGRVTDRASEIEMGQGMNRLRAGPHKGGLFPVTTDVNMNRSFDPSAGILGDAKKFFVDLPRDVMTGELDPTSQEGVERTFEGAAMVSPGSVAARAGEAAIPGALKAVSRPGAKAPTTEALLETGRQGYRDVRKMGVEYDGQTIADQFDDLHNILSQDGIVQPNAPKSFAILEMLRKAPAGSTISPTQLHGARKALRTAAMDFNNPGEQTAAVRIMDLIDRTIVEPNSKNVVAGPAAQAGKIWDEANGNYGAGKRSEGLVETKRAAALRAAAANSGKNIGNSTRGRVASILLSKKGSAGFNDAEISALEGVVEGTTTRNTLRDLGNSLGGGGGIAGYGVSASGATLGAAVGGTAGAFVGATAPFIAGRAAKTADNVLTKKALSEADEAIRKRSPLYKQMAKDVPGLVSSPEKRSALVRAILMEREDRR